MKNKLQYICLALLVFVLAGKPAGGLAQSPAFDLQYDADRQDVVISGFAGEKYSGLGVTISVLNEGKNITSPDDVTKENIGEYISHATQVKVMQDGSFSENFKFNASKSERYIVRVLIPGSDGAVSCELNFLSETDAAGILKGINSIDRTDPDAAKQAGEIICGNELMILLENTAFYDLKKGEAGLEKVYENVLKTSEYTKISELLESIQSVSVLELFNKPAETEKLKGYILKHSEYFNKEEEIYKAYTELDESDKTKIAEAVRGRGYGSLTALLKDFEQNTLLRDILKADSWSKMRSSILNYDSKYHSEYGLFKDLDIVGFKSLSDSKQYSVIEYILKNADKITDVNSFIKMFDEQVETAEKSSDKGSDSAQGSGGGGGGGNGGKSEGIANVPKNTADKETPGEDDETRTKFTDLDIAEWAKDSIIALFDAGVVSGRSETIFDPSAGVTREEFVKLIVAGFGLDEEAGNCTFKDADSSAWYYKYLAAAQKHGIVYGDEDGNFGVGSGITRQDMAVMLYRMLQSSGIEILKIKDELIFTDEDLISVYAKEAVAALQQCGVINGMEDGSFAPLKGATRAEAAKMIHSIMIMADKI